MGKRVIKIVQITDLVVFVELERVGLQRRLRDHRLLHGSALGACRGAGGRRSRHSARSLPRVHVIEGILAGSLSCNRGSSWCEGRVLEPRGAKHAVDVGGRVGITARCALLRVVRVYLATTHGRVVVQWCGVEGTRAVVNLGCCNGRGSRVPALVAERVLAALAREHGHVLRETLVDGTLVRALDTTEDPDEQENPEEATNTNTDTNNDVALALVALRLRVAVRCSGNGCRDTQWVGRVNLSSQLAGDAGLVVQWRLVGGDIRLQSCKLLIGDVSEPLSAESSLGAVVRGWLVDLETVCLDFRRVNLQRVGDQSGHVDKDLSLGVVRSSHKHPWVALEAEQDGHQSHALNRVLGTAGAECRLVADSVGREDVARN